VELANKVLRGTEIESSIVEFSVELEDPAFYTTSLHDAAIVARHHRGAAPNRGFSMAGWDFRIEVNASQLLGDLAGLVTGNAPVSGNPLGRLVGYARKYDGHAFGVSHPRVGRYTDKWKLRAVCQ
jgi:hypothetical protein